MFRISFRRYAQTLPPWHAQFAAQIKEYSSLQISYDVKLYDPALWSRQPFVFHEKLWDPNAMSTTMKSRLCLGKEAKEYTLIGEAFSFPDAEDSPVVNDPQHTAKIWWDHESPTEKIMLQFTPNIPPLLWLGIRPTLSALKKVFVEFLDADADHMKKYLPEYEERQQRIEEASGAQLSSDATNKHTMKDTVMAEMRKKDPSTFELDWEKECNVFVGTFDNPRVVESKFMKNPFVFGWPLLVGDGNHFLEDKPLRVCAFRTILSKSIILIQCRLDLQIDPRMSSGENSDLVLEVPTFATINYRPNERMCGGEALVKRYNTVMGSDFPLDTPIDVLSALCREQVCKSTIQIREEIDFLSRVIQKGVEPERHPRLPNILHSSNKVVGQLGYAIVYLACMEDPRWVDDVFQLFHTHDQGMVRIACAKGAGLTHRNDLVKSMVEKEKDDSVRTTIEKFLMD